METQQPKKTRTKAKYFALVDFVNIPQPFTAMIEGATMKELNAVITEKQILGDIKVMSIIKGTILPHKVHTTIEVLK